MTNNADRVNRARRALKGYLGKSRFYDPDDAVADLLADLMHFCDEEDVNFNYVLDRARLNHDAEASGEPEGVSVNW